MARDLDLTESSLRSWVERAQPRAEPSSELSATERQELLQLRKENRVLRMERELLIKGALCPKRAALAEAVHGRFDRNHAFLLGKMLEHVEAMERAVAECDAQISELLQAEQRQLEHLMTIPGVGRRTAEILLAEIGRDMSRFKTSAHRASWARICPGNHQSAGKRYSGHTGQGNNWLRTALVECSWSVTRTKDTYWRRSFGASLDGADPKKAAIAVATASW